MNRYGTPQMTDIAANAAQPRGLMRAAPPPRRRRRTPGRCRARSTGRRAGSRGRRARRSSRSASGVEYALWLVATITTSAPVTASSKLEVGVATTGSCTDDVGQLALEQPDQLVRQRVALVVGVALEGQPEHGDAALAQRAAEPALDRRRRGTAARSRARARPRAACRARSSAPRRTRSPCAGTCPAVRPGSRHPAARIVAVDQLDDVEDVRAVALAVHHQQVRAARTSRSAGCWSRSSPARPAPAWSARSARRAARTAARRARRTPRRRRRRCTAACRSPP